MLNNIAQENNLKRAVSLPQRKRLKESLEAGSKSMKRSTSFTSTMSPTSPQRTLKMEADDRILDLGQECSTVLAVPDELWKKKNLDTPKSKIRGQEIVKNYTAESEIEPGREIFVLHKTACHNLEDNLNDHRPLQKIEETNFEDAFVKKEALSSDREHNSGFNEMTSGVPANEISAETIPPAPPIPASLVPPSRDVKPSNQPVISTAEQNYDEKNPMVVDEIQLNVLWTDIPFHEDDQSDRHPSKSSFEGSCEICYQADSDEMMYCSYCCSYVCRDCMHQHIKTRITNGFTLIRCPGDSCTKVLIDDEIEHYCEEFLALYKKIKVDAENNPRWKSCPGCNKIHHFPGPVAIPEKDKCSSCGIMWCVKCHAPWHVGMSCGKYQKDIVGKGRKALKIWAKCKGTRDVVNARKCPHCRFFIERITGCDHMSCTKCGTDFCFQCGKKHRSAWLLGDHYSRYRFFGCKYNFAGDKPALRIAARSGVLIASLLALPVAAGVLVTTGCVLIAVTPILVPAVLIKKKFF